MEIEHFERQLSSILERVIAFVAFAEAKNGAVLTFSSAWVALLATQLPLVLTGWTSYLIYLAWVAFTASALIAITSFLPKLALQKMHKDPNGGKSLLYFGDIANFAPAAYKDRVRERYLPPSGKPCTQNYIDDLSVQIAVNSLIAVAKFRKFNWAAVLAFVGIASLTVYHIAPIFKHAWGEFSA